MWPQLSNASRCYATIQRQFKCTYCILLHFAFLEVKAPHIFIMAPDRTSELFHAFHQNFLIDDDFVLKRPSSLI